MLEQLHMKKFSKDGHLASSLEIKIALEDRFLIVLGTFMKNISEIPH